VSGRRRGRAAALLAMVTAGVACSDINETDGIIALAVAVPTDLSLEVGESAELAAWGLTPDGDSVGTDVSWIAADTTVAVDPTGIVTALFPGPGRVQAQSGSIVSDIIGFTITATPDTLIVPEPATLDVAADAQVSDPLLPRLETLDPSVPVSGASITFRIVDPVFPTPDERTVELTGGPIERTVTTGALGTPGLEVRVQRVAGVPQPATATIEVTALLPGGAPVPGSGQQIIVRFN
jgi:hypothetical protein